MKINKEQRKRAEKESKERRNRDHDDREAENNINRDFNIHRHPDKKKSARKVEGFGGNANNDDRDNLKSESVTYAEMIKNVFTYNMISLFYL